MAASYKQKSKREPAKLKASVSRSLKTQHLKSGQHDSLKAWARKQKDDVTSIQVEGWFHNKGVNTSSVEQCIGRTRTRVKKGGGAKDKNLTGK